MKNSTYLKLQLKRAFKVYPAILLITVITLSSIVLCAFVMLDNMSKNNSRQALSLAVVGDVDDTYLEVGIYALQNMDSSRFFIQIDKMTEDEANSALRNRTLDGYVIVPDDFVRSIQLGKNVPATLVTLGTPDNLGTVMTLEAVDIISFLLTETQVGVYSSQSVLYDHGYKWKEVNAVTNDINLAYADFVLNRDNVYEFEVLGVADELSFVGYYICGLLLFFLLLWGLSCNKLLSFRNISLARSLNANRMGPGHQLFCEYMGFFAITLVTLVLLAAVFGIAVWNTNTKIPELVSVGLFESIGYIIGIIPVIVMITAMQKAFYEITTGHVSSVLLQFLSAVGLGYISGCFYPNYFFPDAIRKFADILPSGAGFEYMRKLMSGNLQPENFLLPALYTVLFGLCSYFMRKRRIAGDNV